MDWYKGQAKAKLRKFLEVQEGTPINYRFEGGELYIRYTFQNAIIPIAEMDDYITQLWTEPTLVVCKKELSESLEDGFQVQLKEKTKREVKAKEIVETQTAYESLSDEDKAKADRINQGRLIIEPIKTKSTQIQILALYDAKFTIQEIPKVIKVDNSYLNEIITKYGNVVR
jgi:hypothetical protein